MDARVKQIFEHFGVRTQLNKLNEELMELENAILGGNKEDITQEIADTYVMIAQFMEYYNITELDVLKKIDFNMNGFISQQIEFIKLCVKIGEFKELVRYISNLLVIVIQVCKSNKIKLHEVVEQIDYKLDRTIERMESGYYEGEKW